MALVIAIGMLSCVSADISKMNQAANSYMKTKAMPKLSVTLMLIGQYHQQTEGLPLAILFLLEVI